MFGLDPDTLRNIREGIRKLPQIEKVILYGSRAKGNYHTGSDIDLTLYGKNLTLNNSVYPLMDELEELYLPYTFDISIFDHIDNQDLVEHINRVGKVFFLKEKGLPDGWEVKKLGEVCEIYQPKTISKKDMLINGEFPVFGANGVIGQYDKYNHEDAQLLVTCRGATCGSVNISLPKSWINGNVMVIKPKGCSLKRDFLEYFFRGGINISNVITGAAQPQITRQNLSPVEIPIPPLPEQKHIVSILDRAFEAIDKAKDNAEQNLKNAKELFESYLQGVFDSNNWEKEQIKLLSSLVTKGSSPNWQGVNYVENGGIFFLTSKNVGEGELLLDNKKYLEKKFNDIQKTSILKKGDVLTNIFGASIGRTAIFDLNETTNINQAVCLMRCLPNKIYNYYLMHLLNSPFFKNILHDNEVNNARANLSLTFFKNLQIPVPELSEQKMIVNKIGEFKEETKKLESIYQKKPANLTELKKSILQKAFEGGLK